MQEATQLPMRIKTRNKSLLRKIIIFFQRICVICGIVFLGLIIGTTGAIENNADLFYGTIKILIYIFCVFLSYSAYKLLDIALLWEHKRRINCSERRHGEARKEINQGSESSC